MKNVPITLSQKDIDRFWDKVEIRGENDCWQWKAKRSKRGYGQFRVGEYILFANRVALTINLGRQITDGLGALHDCDNPSCCNPKHLHEGSQSTNMIEAVQRNRHGSGRHKDSFRGERNGYSKLTEDLVIQIRKMYASGDVTYNNIAKKLGISRQQVCNIVTFKHWKHVGGQ